MTGKQGTGAEALRICCGEVLDITSVADFRLQLLEALTTKQPVELDASGVERADTAALQLLSAFMQDAHSQQQTVHWKDPSPALRQSAALLGLSPFLQLESVPT
ncbi:MAG: STAS domain-containing protein [Gammaproteobacteria bacterium]|nr:STAS domain-containing protein [Gammaproteobacteria bacterium]